MFQIARDSKEFKSILNIALPLTAAYLAEFAMFVTTKMVVGQLGYHELAAVGIAGNLSFEILVVLMGLLSIVGVLCAQAEGADDKIAAGLAVRQGFIVSLVIGLPAMLLIWNIDSLLEWTGQDEKIVALSTPYIRQLSGFVLPVLFFAVIRNFVSALSKPRAVMVITVLAVFINYLLTVWFVYGGWGLAPMGLAGAGLATNLVSWLMFFSLLFYIYKTPSLRGYGVFAGRWKYDSVLCKEIITLGTPIAGLVLLEAGLFTATSFLSGIISAETLAAYELVMSWAGIPFVVALGIAEATMVRVAHGVGRNNLVLARQSGVIGMGMGIVILVILMIVPLGFSSYIIDLFISPDDPGFKVVSLLAVQFLMIGAIFQVFDGLQAIAARALRGVKDSVAPLIIGGIGYWVFGVGGGSLLAFKFEMEGAGLWWGLALGLIITATLLALRFLKLSSQMIQRSSR